MRKPDQTRTFIDVPNDEKMKQKVKEKMPVPFHHSAQYSMLKNHHPGDSGDLQFVLEGVSRVGDEKDMEVKMVTVLKLDGTPEEVVEPFDAIMSGNASIDETHNFLTHYILARIEPAERNIRPGEDIQTKHLYSHLWHKKKPEFLKILSAESDEIARLKAHYRQKAYNESMALGIQSPDGEKSPLTDFKSETGDIWEEFRSLKTKLFSETISNIKILAGKLTEEMEVAKTKLAAGDMEAILNDYGERVR